MMEHLEGLDAIAERLNFKRLGWHRHVNEETGDVALFPTVPFYRSGTPEQLKQEREFEQRALAMHEAQEPVWLEAKPEENTLAARKGQIIRGD